jgi:hypothetical protein
MQNVFMMRRGKAARGGRGGRRRAAGVSEEPGRMEATCSAALTALKSERDESKLDGD